MAKKTEVTEAVATPEAETTSTEMPTGQPPAAPRIVPPQPDGIITAQFQAAPVLPSDLPATPAEQTGELVTKEAKTPTTEVAPEPTITQADIDKIIAARLKQERAKFADYDDLKAKVAAQEDAQKTEAQKTLERLQALETANKQLATEAQSALIRAAITAAASDIGLDATAAYKLADLNALKFESGEATNADEIVKAVAEAYPGLIRRATVTAQAPALNATKAPDAKTRTDDDRRRDYYGGSTGGFWTGGGVRGISDQ
jgi:hypothetical protein